MYGDSVSFFPCASICSRVGTVLSNRDKVTEQAGPVPSKPSSCSSTARGRQLGVVSEASGTWDSTAGDAVGDSGPPYNGWWRRQEASRHKFMTRLGLKGALVYK